jgi:hypothetical protein
MTSFAELEQCLLGLNPVPQMFELVSEYVVHEHTEALRACCLIAICRSRARTGSISTAAGARVATASMLDLSV